MKKIFLSLIFILGVGYSFFVQANENFIREKKNISLKSSGNNLEVSITEVWKNKTNEFQNFMAFLPVHFQSQNRHLFINKGGRSFETLEGEYQKNRIFQEAKKENNSKILGMGNFPFSKLLVSENLEIKPQESINIKWVYTQDLDFISDFYFSSIFLDDGIQTEKLNMELVRDGVVFHAISPFFSKGEKYGKDLKFIWKYEANKIKNKNFTFFLSGSENPKLEYKYGNEFFTLQFKKVERKNIFKQKTVLLFDNSGSMYGTKWHRVQNLLPEILKNIPELTNLKIGFFGNNFSWIKEKFEKNNFENQKFWKKSLNFVTPKGASDWNYFLEKISELKEEGVENIILVGDFSDFPTNIKKEKIKSLNFNILALDFSDQDYFKFFMKYLNGQSLKLFESAYSFSEKETFLEKLRFLNSKIISPKSLAQTFLPIQRNWINQNSQVFVARKIFSGESYSPLADFIPEIFGQYKVADYLKKLEKENLTEDIWQALNSINRYFGTGVLNSGENFKEKFLKISEKNLWETIWNLESSQPKISEIKKSKAESFFGSPILTGLSYRGNKFPKQKTLKIAPFSEAYEALWKNFPEIFSEKFSLSAQVRFCTEFRCIEVSHGGTEEFSSDILFYWKGFDLNHWGYEFAEILAKKNIIPVSNIGKIEFSKTVTRGEFISWIYDFKEGVYNTGKLPENFIEKPNLELNNSGIAVISDLKKSEEIFSDLPKDLKIKNAILWMKNKGVIQGYPDKTVRPNQPLTRAEAVKILLALSGFVPNETEKLLEKNIFTDVSGWSKPWINEAFERDMVKGYENKTFKPQSLLNYAEAFKLIVKN